VNGRPIDCDRLLLLVCSLYLYLEPFARQLKETIGFVCCVRPSVRLEELGAQTEEFS